MQTRRITIHSIESCLLASESSFYYLRCSALAIQVYLNKIGLFFIHLFLLCIIIVIIIIIHLFFFVLFFIIFVFLQCIDSGKLPLWKNQLAPKIAVNYWKLPVSVWLNDRRIFVYNMRLSSISDTIFDGTSSMLVLNMKWHSTINCPKEFEPDVLNTFCATRA